ncbi:hypothetical protein F442_17907 [Phytophthora nicotianae P10297]|uniref:Uncharacterized protein n=1 Tax=Phytophthora nicotianae P10297 TaxID=1317064 RepID=W2YF47_PHYNI|nr:hypothetical protein F442_17907 [Phytophthora nicotianae P10297]
MPLFSLARFFSLSSLGRRHRRGEREQRRIMRSRSSRRVQEVSTVKGVVHIPYMEATSVEFDIRSNRSISSSFYVKGSAACPDHRGLMNSLRSFRAQGPVEVAKKEQKKLRKALERAVKQGRKEARKMQKLAKKSDRSVRERGGSCNRIALLSTTTVSDCSVMSDQEILAEIWAMRSSSMGRVSDESMPVVDDKLADTAPMEFLFFTGCPDDNSLDVRHRRARSKARLARYSATPSFTTTVPVKSTLVSNMPPLFVPRF